MIEQVAGDFMRRIEMPAGYDCRVRCEHETKGNHGQHCVELRFLLIGPKGATQFLLYTGWYPEHAQDDWRAPGPDRKTEPMPADLGYHAYEPQYEGQTPMACDLLIGADQCYYDGSGLNAERPFAALLRGGDEAVWDTLLDYYRSLFDETAKVDRASDG